MKNRQPPTNNFINIPCKVIWSLAIAVLPIYIHFIILLQQPVVYANNESAWDTLGGGDWFNASNWDGPIPNAPGDIAHLQNFTNSDIVITMPSQVTLGQLNFLGQPDISITGAGPLVFDQPDNSLSRLQLTGTDGYYQIDAPIGIADDDKLLVSIPAGVLLSATQGITVGDGDLTKSGLGRFNFSGSSTDWDGVIRINQGSLSIVDASSLGTAIGETRINNGGTLTLLQNATIDTELLVLDGGTISGWGTSSGSKYPVLNNTIELLTSGHLANVNSSGRLTQNGVIEGAGDLYYDKGIFFINADNTYEGLTTIESGYVSINHVSGLGTTSQGTVVNQHGTLFLQQAVLEPIVLNGGELRFASTATSTGTLTLKSGLLRLPRDTTFSTTLHLENTGGDPEVRGDNTILDAGITGNGDLILTGTITLDGLPAANNGDLVVRGTATLNSANTYTGDTLVDNGVLIVNHADALGVSTNPVSVPSGRLTLNVPINRDVTVGGTLQIDDPLVEFDQTVRLGSNSPLFPASGRIEGNGIYNGEIIIEDTPNARPIIRGGKFNGIISGVADELTLGGDDPVKLNANNTYQGITHISGNSSVEVNSAFALGDTELGTLVPYGKLIVNTALEESLVVIDRGKVELNAHQERLPRLFRTRASRPNRLQKVAINTASTYEEHVDVTEGILEINADTTLGEVEVREFGTLQVTDGNTLTINSTELVMQSGKIEGRIAGPSTLRKTTTRLGEIDSLPEFAGNIVVEAGTLILNASPEFEASEVEFFVASPHNAVLQLGPNVSSFDDLFVDSNISLNNAHGEGYAGALWFKDDNVFLSGQLDLGEVGSTIHGLKTSGPIVGGELSIVEGATITSSGHTYNGPTKVRSGTLYLGGDATLQSTSSIVLQSSGGSFPSSLSLEFQEILTADRIGDTIPILFHGGELIKSGRSNVSESESFGEWRFMEGKSSVKARISKPPEGVVNQFNVASIVRERGATVDIRIEDQAEINIGPSPPLQGGLLPWMVVQDESSPSFAVFGTVVDGQIRAQTANDYVTDINTAVANENVYISANNTVLASDKTINALTFGSHLDLDLDGHTLQVESGGILLANGGDILNGTLVAGDSSQNELIFHGRGGVNAAIIDNGDVPVDVTIAPGASTYNVFFSGNNTYSGKTRVSKGNLLLTTESSLPDSADLDIFGGEVRVGFYANSEMHLGEVRIAGGGALTHKGGHGIFSFDEIVLEEGTLSPGQLVGSGQIVKRSIGYARISTDINSTYSGNVVIEEGRLFAAGIPQASFLVSGGELHLPSGENNIELAGGDLLITNELSGNILVTDDSRIAIEEYFGLDPVLSGEISGTGNLSFGSQFLNINEDDIIEISGESPNFTGNVEIDSVGVFIGKELSLGTGDITIMPGGRLRLSPRQGNYENSKLDLANDVFLQGAELLGSGSVFRQQQLLGDLHVSGHSLISTINVLGTTYLEDGSRLTMHDENVVKMLGNMKIGGNTTIEYGLAENLDAGINNTQLLGVISSDAENAVLNLIDRGLHEIQLDATFHVSTGQSLLVLKNGLPIELIHNSVTGNGTLLNPIIFGDGSVISPGESPGTLTLGSTATLNSNTIYEWEINDALSAAGQSNGWDLLQVSELLTFDATELDPIVIQMVGLDNLGQEGTIENFDPNRSYQWLIATAGSMTGFDPSHFQIDTSRFVGSNPLLPDSRFSVSTADNHLFLNYQIPEPSTLALTLATLCLIAIRRRH